MPSEEQAPKSLQSHDHDAHHHPLHPSWRNPWVIIASALVVVFILFSFVSFHRVSSVMVRQGFPGGPGMMKRGFGQSRFGVNPSGATDTRISGVVTAISGSTLTIAGNGTTHAVTTTSSTQYSGASAAAVNDTVVADGTTSGSTFTATNIVVNP